MAEGRYAKIRRLLNPVFYFGWRERREAIETTAGLAAKDLVAMTTAMLMSCNDIGFAR